MDERQSPAQDVTEASFRLLVNGVRDYAIYMMNPQGIIVSWNTGAERIKGYPPAEAIGRHFSLFYTAEDVAAGRPEQELRLALSRGRYEEEGWRQRKDGTRFRAYVVVTPLYDEHGGLTGYAKVTQDVTDRWHAEQALRESEERFRILVAQIRDYAIFMLDPSGHISTWNLGAERIKGYRAEEIIGRPLATFYPPEDRAAGVPQKLLSQAEREGKAHDVGWRMRKDGTRFWGDITLTALRTPNGELYGYAKVVRDLTEQMEAEAQAKAYAAARKAIQVRDDFLSIAAHELRTPLTAAQLHLQGVRRLTERPPQDWNHERIAAGVQSALRSGDRLAELVETLLDVSRIAADRIQLNLSEFDLAQACRDAAERLSAVTREAGCELHLVLPEPVPGRWDRLRVEQALLNLIANAAKYAPHSRIELGLERRGADRVRLWVRDTGPGIAAEHVERIFGRFERAVPSTNYGGLGLGLYVTRQIVEAHGGSVEVDSSPGEGSTFSLLLPLHTAAAE